MLPATKAVPKEMLPVAGKPLIQYAVEEAAASGIETVIIVTRNHRSLIQAHFARDHELECFLDERRLSASTELIRRPAELAHLRYVQQENPLGLAHALVCARSVVEDEPFVVLLPDVITVNDEPVTLQLIRAHEQRGGSFVAIRQIESQEVERFGVARVERSTAQLFEKSVRVTGLVEKPRAKEAPSQLGVFGRYLLEPAIWDAIAHTDPDPRGELQLTDSLNLLCQTKTLFGLCFEGEHYDAGDRIGYIMANIALSLRGPDLRQPLLECLARLQT
jgi:UTP--glucose-1-phosphate uridylyltransferase